MVHVAPGIEKKRTSKPYAISTKPVLTMSQNEDQSILVSIPLDQTKQHQQYWLIRCKNPVTVEQMDFRKVIWGLEERPDVEKVKKIVLTESQKALTVTIPASEITRTYIYRDYSHVGTIDGGYYYCFDLPAYYKKHETSGLSAVTDTPDFINFKITVASERVVDRNKETKILSQPSAGTMIGEDAGIKVTSKFTTEVPGYEDSTIQEGDAGVVLNFTPTMDGSNIFLKGVVEISKLQSILSLDEMGEVAVQNAIIVQFSLKTHEDKPIELSPIAMPDGSKLLITFNATTDVINKGTDSAVCEKQRYEEYVANPPAMTEEEALEKLKEDPYNKGAMEVLKVHSFIRQYEEKHTDSGK